MFARNASIEFLNLCKHLCQNFLDLLDNNDREKSIQDVFKSIIMRHEHSKRWSSKELISLSLGEENIIDRKSLGWLVEAMKAAATKINNLTGITISDVTTWTEMENIGELIQLQQGDIEILTVHNSVCELYDEHSPQFCAMTNILRASKNWEIEELKLGNNRGSFSSVRGEHLHSLHFKGVSCWKTNDVTLLCALLKKSKNWTIEYLDLLNICESNWTILAEMANKGSIETVRVTEAGIRITKEEDLRSIWISTTKEWTWHGMNCYARKSEGDSGLQKLFAIKSVEEEQWVKNHKKLIETKTQVLNVDPSVRYFELAKERELANEVEEIERMQLDYALRMSLEEEDTKDMAIVEEGTEDMTISKAHGIDKTPLNALTEEEMLKNIQMTRMSVQNGDGGYLPLPIMTEEEMLQMAIEKSVNEIYQEDVDEFSEYETCSSDLNESSGDEKCLPD